MKKHAIIVAGGLGTRMNTSIPKQFLLLKGKPVLYYTLKSFLNAYEDLQIILVLPAEHLDKGETVIDKYFSYDRIQITTGGQTRFESVKNGLILADEDSIIMVHDAVRCLVTVDLIQRCYESALIHGSAIPSVQPHDSVRLLTETGHSVFNRTNLRLIQTPQVFKGQILKSSFQASYQEIFTDEASVVEAAGHSVHLIEGEENNIKITTNRDHLIAETLI